MINTIQIEKLKAVNGDDILKVNGYLLHSKYNPINESEKFVNNKYIPEAVHILFGVGAGHIVKAFIEKIKPEDKLIIFDPYFDISLDIDELDNVVILPKTENIKDLKQDIYNILSVIDKYEIICSPNYDKIFPEIYKEFLSLIKENITVARINENTILSYSELWQKNYLDNLSYAIHDVSIAKIEQIYDCPVIVASGGPSLTKQLPLLKQIREYVILIAAGSTINSLVKEDIIPDYVISIDGSPINYEHYKNLGNLPSKFVYLMSSYPKIRTVFKNQCYFALSHTDKALVNHLEKITQQEVLILPGGGSVAHYAFSLAMFISKGPVALIGQDLAYTGKKSHANNNVLSKDVDFDSLEENGVYIEGYNGGEVLTDYPFLGMKETFENIVKLYSEESDRIFNSTEGGAKIKGYNQISFKDFCERFIITDSPKSNVMTIEATKFKKKDNYTLLKMLKEEIKVYGKMLKLLENNIKLISNNKFKTHFSDKILEQLDENDKYFEEYCEMTALSLSLDPIKIEVLKHFKPIKDESPEDAYIRIKAQNLTMYRKFITAVNDIKIYTNIVTEKIIEEQRD